jgi:hypothetical protein
LNATATVFLGLIALGSLVQVAFLAWLGIAALRLYREGQALRARSTERSRPLREALGLADANASEMRRLVAEETRRIRVVRAETATQWRALATHLGGILPGGGHDART